MTKEITRSQLVHSPEYFDRYINQNDDVTMMQALTNSLDELNKIPLEKWKAIGNRVYAAGKWTINDIIQHIIDTERVFSYRALSFGRGEQNVMPFDEELYGKNAMAVNRSLDDLIEEALIVRRSTVLLFSSFDDVILNRMGIGFKGTYTVQDIGFIIAGHQRWHFNIIEERYMPLAHPEIGRV